LHHFLNRPLWPSLSSPGRYLSQLDSVATAATAATGASAAASGKPASKARKDKQASGRATASKSEAKPPSALTGPAAPATHSIAPSAVAMNPKFGDLKVARLPKNMETLKPRNWFNDEVCPRV
jgi:hypothetical protein